MSLDTWKEEFYPVTALDLVMDGASKLELIRHSLKKWRGLTKENLKKHDIAYASSRIFCKDGTLEINSQTCALCMKHQFTCEGCPFEKLRETDSEPCNLQYREFLKRQDPVPMIEALEQLEQMWRRK